MTDARQEDRMSDEAVKFEWQAQEYVRNALAILSVTAGTEAERRENATILLIEAARLSDLRGQKLRDFADQLRDDPDEPVQDIIHDSAPDFALWDEAIAEARRG